MSHRVVLITGCSKGGIGFALCESFAEKGCKVYATSRKLATVSGFRKFQHNIEALEMDVSNVEQVEAVVKQILEREGRIDVLVNNAGAVAPGPMVDYSMEEVVQKFELNTFAPLRLTKAVFPSMAQRRSGLIINVGSVVGDLPTPWNGLYSATKAALHTMTDVLWMECKPFNINVMLVSPSAVKSNIASTGLSDYQLPQGSFYGPWLAKIHERINSSQAPGSMPAEEFSRRTVAAAFQSTPPRYIHIGGMYWLWVMLRTIPKAWGLWFMARRFMRH